MHLYKETIFSHRAIQNHISDSVDHDIRKKQDKLTNQHARVNTHLTDNVEAETLIRKFSKLEKRQSLVDSKVKLAHL